MDWSNFKRTMLETVADVCGNHKKENKNPRFQRTCEEPLLKIMIKLILILMTGYININGMEREKNSTKQ